VAEGGLVGLLVRHSGTAGSALQYADLGV
jgi:hypothetical protein